MIKSELCSVSVVVSTYTIKRAAILEKCIHSLLNQTHQPIEIILVLDPIKELVEFYKTFFSSEIKIIESDKIGLSHARNAGINHASGSIISFIDDDAIANNDWIETIVKTFSVSKDIVAVGGTITPYWEYRRPRWIPNELDWILGCSYNNQAISKVRNLIGCNMSFRKSVFNLIGNFDTSSGRVGNNYVGGEDTEICIRISKRLSGSIILHNPAISVRHFVPRSRTTLSYFINRSYNEGVTKAMLSQNKQYFGSLQYEMKYLCNLLFRSLPNKIFKPSHFISILVSIISVGLGYIWYSVRYH